VFPESIQIKRKVNAKKAVNIIQDKYNILCIKYINLLDTILRHIILAERRKIIFTQEVFSQHLVTECGSPVGLSIIYSKGDVDRYATGRYGVVKRPLFTANIFMRPNNILYIVTAAYHKSLLYSWHGTYISIAVATVCIYYNTLLYTVILQQPR